MYNDWSNYETWYIAHFLTNTKFNSDFWKDKIRECRNAKSCGLLSKEAAVSQLGDEIQQAVRNNCPISLDNDGFYSGIVKCFIQEVHFCEIAQDWIEAQEEAEQWDNTVTEAHI